MTVKQRLIEFLKHNKIGQKKFAELIGVSSGYVNAIRVSIQPDTIHKIAMRFPELNTGWLLTGEGEMLKNEVTKQDRIIEEVETIKDTNYKLVPLYNFDAVGGMSTCNDVMDTPSFIERYVPFIDSRDEDICIPITGNSMIPTYSPGSIVLLREITHWREYFGYGHVFVLILTDGRRIIKEVRKSEDNPKDNVLCVSYNYESSAPEDLPKNMIYKVYKVIKVLTNEGF